MVRSAYTPFTFEGVNSADYDVYVSSVAYFNTPARDYEYSEVPGRNGDLIIDNRRFKNIDVKYNCYCRDITKLDAWKEAMLQVEGYGKLSCDALSSETYRMASLSNAIEVPTFDHKAASFSVTFNCKPQRLLYSGDRYSYTFSSTTTESLITGTNTTEAITADAPRQLFKKFGYAKAYLYRIDLADVPDVFWLYRGGCKASGFPFAIYDPAFVDNPLYYGFPMYGSSSGSKTVIDKSGVEWTAPQLLIVAGEYFEIGSENTVLIRPLNGDPVGTITSPTRYSASPLLCVHINQDPPGVPCMMINDSMIQVDVPQALGYDDQTISISEVYIDCQSMTAYTYINGDKDNPGTLGSYVEISGDASLKPGENKIWVNGCIKSVDIMPRWWTI